MHQNDYLVRELIDKGEPVFGVEGVRREKGTKKVESEPVVHTKDDFIDSFCALALAQITKKAGIAYPADTTLLVKCLLNSLYMPDEWKLLMDKVQAGLPSHKFPEIFLFDANSDHACSFYGKVEGTAARHSPQLVQHNGRPMAPAAMASLVRSEPLPQTRR